MYNLAAKYTKASAYSDPTWMDAKLQAWISNGPRKIRIAGVFREAEGTFL